MITGEQKEEKSEALVVSWSSLDKRKAEYEELINKKIPENSKEIGGRAFLRRSARKFRVQGGEGNAGRPDAAESRSWRRRCIARAGPLSKIRTRRRFPLARL